MPAPAPATALAPSAAPRAPVPPAASPLDDVCAAAARISARQRQECGGGGGAALDAIPPLSRPLAQLRRDTRAAAAAHAAPPPDAVHARAMRLLAAAPAFKPERLRRAVDDFAALAGADGRPADPGHAAPWLDGDVVARREFLSVGELQARHRDAIVAHAADHLRLDSSLAFRNSFRDAMVRDLAAAKLPLVALLRGVVDPAAAIPSPFVSMDHTPDPTPPPTAAVARLPAPMTVQVPLPGSAPSQDFPPLSGGRPPRSGGGGRSSATHAASASRVGASGAKYTPSGASARFSRGSPSPARSRPGTPNPKSVATADPDSEFVSTVRSWLFGAEAGSGLATRLLEQARERSDHPHFISCMSILAELCKVSESAAAEQPNLPPGERVVPHDLVCASRSGLESFFAACIGDIPLDVDSRLSAEVREGVRAYVEQLVQSGGIKSTPAQHTDTSQPALLVDGLPFWAQFYFCLRCGSPNAARQLADEIYGDLKDSHFRFFLHRFVRYHKRDDEDDADCVKTDAFLSRNVPGSLTDIHHLEVLASEYQSTAYQSSDPYQRASYVLLARLDLAPPPDVGNGGVSGGGTSGGSGGGGTGGGAGGIHGRDHKMSDGHHGSGGSDLNKRISLQLRSEDYEVLFDSMEDYFWLRLWLCRTEREADAMQHVGSKAAFVSLEQIQDEVRGYGHGYFDADGRNPLLYAFVLVSAGLPWQAVEYLASQQSPVLSAYAAYLAFPMYAMGWAPSETAFASVMWAYTLHFSCDYPLDATLCMFTVKDRSLLRTCMHRLVVDTGKFVELLGDGKEKTGAFKDVAGEIRTAATGKRRPIDGIEIPPESEDNNAISRDGEYAAGGDGDDFVAFIESVKQDIASSLAEEFSAVGASGSSGSDGAVGALMYAVCGNTEKEREVIVCNLASYIPVQEDYALREAAIKTTRDMLAAAVEKNDSGNAMPDTLRRSIVVLLEMAAFFDDFWDGQLEEAWGRLVGMGVLPLDKSEIRERQVQFASSSGYYVPAVAALLPAVMRTALEIAESCLSGEDSGGGRRYTPRGYASGVGPHPAQVIALSTFAGIMRLAERTEMNARLVRLELLMSS